ncbi:hypothetical protein OH720_12755 [Pseudomonas sp. WJP1]|uniref:hypothetical protein n=1 Tax=Pseudomonas sp. WJP1 TaxID=2986947 RepID=UPI00234AE870|nr:hypothetical protein [Pseudomonas sp. WJP1]WCM53835.1 hypothetical protein OH720_12755 [Pseudomonas sp. WJP1]
MAVPIGNAGHLFWILMFKINWIEIEDEDRSASGSRLATQAISNLERNFKDAFSSLK